MRVVIARVNTRALVAATVATALAACGDPRQVSSACRKDKECSKDEACRIGACIPRLSGPAQVWAVQMAPRIESSWATTENTGVIFSAEPVNLRVERTVMVGGTITGLDSATSASGVRVVISVTSPVDKRDVLYEGAGSNRSGAGIIDFSVRVPESVIGRPAQLRLIPNPPADRQLPVWTMSVTALARTTTLTAPTPDEMDTIEGVLETPFAGEGVAGYLVRGVAKNRLVTNVDRTGADGRFKLRVPRGPLSQASLPEITVDLTPADPMEAASKLTLKITPELAAKITDGKLILHTIRLPPSPPAQVFDVPVHAAGDATVKLPGITLRFQTVVPGAIGAQALYVREAQTDLNSVAHVALLPGNAGEIRVYSVAALPGPTSDFAARCLSTYSVAAGSGQRRVGASIALAPKVALEGSVVDHLGSAGAGVTVRAERLDTTNFADCRTDVAPSSPSKVTKIDGSFRLLLDPGRYRIEYEPNLGSASALLLEEDVLVESGRRHNVVLPAGVLAEGTVLTPEGAPVTGCEIRVVDPPGDAAVPRQRRARALTGADGTFQVVLPSNQSAPTGP